MSFVVSLTPQEFATSLTVDSDCSIVSVTPKALPALRSLNVEDGTFCVSAIGEEEVFDRGSMRVILEKAKRDVPLQFAFKKIATRRRISISDSVECNGMASSLSQRPVITPKVDDEEESAEPAPPSVTAAPTTGSPAIARPPGGSTSPQNNSLRPSESLSFVTRDTSMSDREWLEFSRLDVTARHDSPARRKLNLRGAVDRVGLGNCIIILTDLHNPVGEIELLAESLKREVVLVPCGVKLRHRLTGQQLTEKVIDAFRTGKWVVLSDANKSIATLAALESVLMDCRSRNLEGCSPNARVFICMEPHPHFPPNLAHGCVTMRFQSSLAHSQHLIETMHSSVSRRELLTRGDPEGSTGDVRKVRISADVNVVEIEEREIYEHPKTPKVVDVTGTVTQIATFQGVTNDKFLCVSSAGSAGRYAVGSSLGNVYIIDSEGRLSLSFHAHNASVWDVSFTSSLQCATGSEDGTAVRWKAANNMMEKVVCAAIGSDIYALKHLRSDNDSPFVVGGLAPTLSFVPPSGKITSLTMPSSVQALAVWGDGNRVVVGAGDGSICYVDSTTQAITNVVEEHRKKVPCITIDGDTLISGSFDSTIRMWDLRTSLARPIHVLRLKDYVTGLDLDEDILAASVGENLYLWDVRKINEVLGGIPGAWKGLSRGVKVDSDNRTIVTSSPDGNVRIWKFR